MAQRHSAKFSNQVIAAMRPWLVAEGAALERLPVVLDPFAGVGGIHVFADAAGIAETHGHELEPEYAREHPMTLVGDSRKMPWDAATFDVIATSPVYPNGMCDQFEASKPETRHGYRHDLRRPLTDGNAALLAQGRRMTTEYRQLHERVYAECKRVATPSALWLVNVSNHYVGPSTEYVVRWHLNALIVLGLDVVEVARVKTYRYRNGANGQRRFPWEHLLVMRGRG